MHRGSAIVTLVAVLGLSGLLTTEAKKKPKGQPDHVTVQHVLIAFKGSMQGKPIERSRKEAKLLAERIYERALAGEEFDALVKEYTDDSYPGIYRMANWGVPKEDREYERDGMVPYFGDVAFELEVGAVGLAKHHAALSNYGWHVIKRLE